MLLARAFRQISWSRCHAHAPPLLDVNTPTTATPQSDSTVDQIQFTQHIPWTIPTSILSTLDAAGRRRAQQIVDQLEVVRFASTFDPHEPPTASEWVRLLGADTKRERVSFMNFLNTKSTKKMKEMHRKQESLARRAERFAENATRPEPFGKSIVMAHNDHAEAAMTHTRNVSNYLVGNALHIVYDLEWMSQMNHHARARTARQLLVCHYKNKISEIPARLSFVNCEHGAEWYENFTQKDLKILARGSNRRPKWSPDDFGGDLLDEFEKRKIIYLTPTARKPLQHVDTDHIYVIGAIIRDPPGPLTEAKANRLGIEARHLPIKNNVKIGESGRLSLNFTQVLEILQSRHMGTSWADAFKTHMNKRFLVDNGDDEETRERRRRMRSDTSAKRQESTTELLRLMPDVDGDRVHLAERKQTASRTSRGNEFRKKNNYNNEHNR